MVVTVYVGGFGVTEELVRVELEAVIVTVEVVVVYVGPGGAEQMGSRKL